MNRARIIIADDHPLVQMALGSTLRTAFPDHEIIECMGLDPMLEVVGRDPTAVDLVLLDLNMPGLHGLAGLFTMLGRFPTVPVAIVSALEEPSLIRRAVAFGASGYIPKSLGMPQMAAAVRAILAGEIWIPEKAEGTAEDESEEAEIARRFASLSPSQMRILFMIVEGKLNKQIASEMSIAEQTVKIHDSTIFRKLGVGTRTQAAVLAGRLAPG